MTNYTQNFRDSLWRSNDDNSSEQYFCSDIWPLNVIGQWNAIKFNSLFDMIYFPPFLCSLYIYTQPPTKIRAIVEIIDFPVCLSPIEGLWSLLTLFDGVNWKSKTKDKNKIK